MQVGALQEDLPRLLEDMGAAYDPQRLAARMGRDPLALSVRALRIASTLGGFVTALLKARKLLSAHKRTRARTYVPGTAPGAVWCAGAHWARVGGGEGHRRAVRG